MKVILLHSVLRMHNSAYPGVFINALVSPELSLLFMVTFSHTCFYKARHVEASPT